MMPSATETYTSAFSSKPFPKISYGLSFPEACAKHASATFNASRVYIIASGSLSRNTDAVKRLVSALGEEKVVGVREGMKPHTLWSEVLEITAKAREKNADLLVTLGAGTLTDAAKIVALALANNVREPSGLWALSPNNPSQNGNITPPTVPIISIPTSLSGGEFSDFAGATEDAKNRKQVFASPTKGPTIVILDPQLTITTPDSIWLSTGIRAVDHCVETFCSLESIEETDREAAKGLQKLIPGLLRSKKNQNDLEARLECQMGVIDAMAAICRGIQLGGSHAIGHQLGPLGVGHGETSCILLPAVCKYNARHSIGEASDTAARQNRVRRILLAIPDVQSLLSSTVEFSTDLEKADLGDILDLVIRALGMPRRLADVGVGRDKLDLLAENSLTDHWAPTNPVPLVEKGQVMEILEAVV